MNPNVIPDFIEKLKKNRAVVGAALFGSVANGSADKFSDIDIYVILRKKPRYSRLNFNVRGTRIDVLFDSVPISKKYLREDRGSLRRPTSHMLANSRILFDHKGELKKLKRIAKHNLKSRTRLSRSELLMHLYSIDDFWGEVQRDFKNKDWVAFGLDSNLLVQNIIELFLKKRGGYLPQSNQLLKALRKTSPRLAILVKSFYQSETAKLRLMKLKNLVAYVNSVFGFMPKSWRIG